MKVECPLGEVVDKVTILRIKERRLTDPLAVEDVRRELRGLLHAWSVEGYPDVDTIEFYPRLVEVNQALWDVEDALRSHERAGDFGDRFVRLARSVYRLNDERAALKRAINHHFGSTLVEHKSYGGGQETLDVEVSDEDDPETARGRQPLPDAARSAAEERGRGEE